MDYIINIYKREFCSTLNSVVINIPGFLLPGYHPPKKLPNVWPFVYFNVLCGLISFLIFRRNIKLSKRISTKQKQKIKNSFAAVVVLERDRQRERERILSRLHAQCRALLRA